MDVRLGQNARGDAARCKLDAIDGPVCITDVRFPNEVELIHSLGGKVIRIDRDGCQPVNGHASETAVDGMEDCTLTNNGTIKDLHNSVAVALSDFSSNEVGVVSEPLSELA